MKSLKQLCVPRASVFDKSRRDVVLDILFTDLAENKIDPDDFFAENYLTDGMKRLLENEFWRFERKSQPGLFRLTQAMGGGKTHTMLVLGLLAKNPKFRGKIMGDLYRAKTSALCGPTKSGGRIIGRDRRAARQKGNFSRICTRR